jgi:hypothetical protein
MNVLVVQFDSILYWSNQINNCIKKANTALHDAIRLIKCYFIPMELKNLITAIFYSILYYKPEVWHLPKLKPILKNHLLAASATALKLFTPSYNKSKSYTTLHSINNRATPSQMMLCEHSILLYKTLNEQEQQPP